MAKECAEGWIACENDPCQRHVEYWHRYNNQTPQPPEVPDSIIDRIEQAKMDNRR